MKYIAIPKNSVWTERIKKACRKAGFRWDGNDCSGQFNFRPDPPWGCIVKKYTEPKLSKNIIDITIGIMIGTHDEFGKLKQR